MCLLFFFYMAPPHPFFFFFFFNDTATTEIYTLSLHDALPISKGAIVPTSGIRSPMSSTPLNAVSAQPLDRKSTRLNSSHLVISYAVFCLKKKKKKSSNNSQRTPSRINLQHGRETDRPTSYQEH